MKVAASVNIEDASRTQIEVSGHGSLIRVHPAKLIS